MYMCMLENFVLYHFCEWQLAEYEDVVFEDIGQF